MADILILRDVDRYEGGDPSKRRYAKVAILY